MCDEITYPFPNINGTTMEVWEWISDVIPRIMMDAIIHPCWDSSSYMLVKSPRKQITSCTPVSSQNIGIYRYTAVQYHDKYYVICYTPSCYFLLFNILEIPFTD